MSFSSQRGILVESAARSLLHSATLHDISSECALIWVAGNGNVPCVTRHSAIHLVSSNISTLIQGRGRISVLSVRRHSIVQMICEDTAEFIQVITFKLLLHLKTDWEGLHQLKNWIPAWPSNKQLTNNAWPGLVVVYFYYNLVGRWLAWIPCPSGKSEWKVACQARKSTCPWWANSPFLSTDWIFPCSAQFTTRVWSSLWSAATHLNSLWYQATMRPCCNFSDCCTLHSVFISSYLLELFDRSQIFSSLVCTNLLYSQHSFIKQTPH